jgi:hypothetical protein
MNQDDDAIRTAIERARRLTEAEPEPFRSLAFRAVLESLLSPSGPVAAATTLAERPAPSLDMDLTEFLVSKKIKTHLDRVVAIAYYIYHTRGGEGVTTKDLEEGYARARVTRPKNFADVIAECIKRRAHLVERTAKDGPRSGPKSWVITRSGETYVEQNL